MGRLVALSFAVLAVHGVGGMGGPSSFNPGFLMEDLLSYPQYEINFLEDLLPASQLQNAIDRTRQNNERLKGPHANDVADKAPDTDIIYEPIVLKATKKWKFLCRVPQVDSEKVRMEEREREDTAVPTGVDAREVERQSIERGLQLLEPMKPGCLTYVEGWWTFEYCHDRSVSQFHRIEQAEPDEYELIKYRLGDPSQRKPLGLPEVPNGQTLDGETEDTRTTQTWGGGSVCEITRRPREIEVQFHCDPNMPERISHIKETSTCQYFMVVTTPRLCEDASFFDPAGIDSDKEYHEIIAQKASLPEAVEEQQHPVEQAPKDPEHGSKESAGEKEESGPATADAKATAKPKKMRKKTAKKAAAEPELITIDLSDPEQVQLMRERDEEVRQILAQLLGDETLQKLLPKTFEESSNRKQLTQDLEKDADADEGGIPQQKRAPEAVRRHDEL
ncbi:hypothetical protein DL89DRAFT_286302 [Linderina pennispora]|uniref:Protein OS-9 homolog n=1 Tax=Linderina pennispora TaxID=61395 RepID=A0A1Y1VZB9_9FUNG|nr:uncharacterized protein DL89DRAFT_286302 [Linderina pennispora]ORX66603.1 hypothetical protein DL89DRAFT_286302 [Linderina pennispora]